MRRLAFVLLLVAGHQVYAHHGGGTFDSSRAVTLSGGPLLGARAAGLK